MLPRLSIVLLLGLLLPSLTVAVPSNRQLPFMAGETWWCSQDWYVNADPYTHRYEPAWDLNFGVTNADLGKPLLAPSDGIVEYSGNTGSGFGNVVLIRYNDGSYDRIAHNDALCVKNQEVVKQGQVVSWCGGTPNWPVHIHVNAQSVSNPSVTNTATYRPCIESSFHYRIGSSDYYGRPTGCSCDYDDGQHRYTSTNHNIFDVEKDALGGLAGDTVGYPHWWPQDWSTGSKYDASNFAQKCYLQDYAGGSWGACAIVYDGLGGARKAYTVRAGFWNDATNGWAHLNGPQSSLGMPITDEYAIDGGRRQDFQKGHLTYVNATGVVTIGPYAVCAPGATASGWNNQYSYLFAMAFERNGARVTVGYPSSYVYDYGPYKRQDFSGGTYGNCCIMYDPNNATGNSLATNEAYLLRTGFYQFYFAGNGQAEYGCPSRDEYHPSESGTGCAIQFFVKRVGSETQQHHMWYDPVASPTTSWNSTYTTAFASQTPSGQFNLAQGASRSFTVKFVNTGEFTWHKDPNAYPYDYVELKSCDSNGATCNSFLNYPYDSSLGWLNSGASCTMNETSVAPGDTATFTFTGYVPSNASVGLHQVYFRPNHSVGGLMEGWGSMNFQVNVLASESFAGMTLTPLAGDWNGDGSFEVGVYADDDRTFYLDTDNDGWTDLELHYSSAIDKPIAGDWNGDTQYSVGFFRPSQHTFYLDYDNNGQMDIGISFGNGSDLPVAGDWLANGYSRIGIYRPSTREFWLDYNNDGTADFYRAFGDNGDTPLAGDWDCDLDWNIGIYRPSTRTFWLDYDNNGSADFSRTYGNNGDLPVVGDWTGNCGTNIGLFRPSTQEFFEDYNSDGTSDRIFTLRRMVGSPKVMIGDNPTSLPAEFSLSQNYPNPFNPTTTISYSLPEASHVTLSVYNILGQCVTTLVNEDQSAGEHTAFWNADRFSSGIYLYRIETAYASESRKMLLLK